MRVSESVYELKLSALGRDAAQRRDAIYGIRRMYLMQPAAQR